MSCQEKAGHPTEYLFVDTKKRTRSFLQRFFGPDNSKKLVLERLKELRPSLFGEEDKGLKWLAYIPPRVLTHYCENMESLRMETLVNAASDLLSQQQKECRRQQSLKHAMEKECRAYREKLQQVATIVRNVLESYGVRHSSHNLEAWRSGESLGREQGGLSSPWCGSEDWVDFTQPCFDRLRACLEEVISICDTSKGSRGIDCFAEEAYLQPSEYVSEVSSLTSSSTVPLKAGGKISQDKQLGNSISNIDLKRTQVTVSHAHHFSDPLACTSYRTSSNPYEVEQVQEHNIGTPWLDNQSQCPSTQSSRYQKSYKSSSSGKSALKTRMPCPDVLLYGNSADFANCNSHVANATNLFVSERQLDEMRFSNNGLQQSVPYSAEDYCNVYVTTMNPV
jgi:hypothetical protein